jgi:maltose O-acetyltransferase
MFEELLSIFRHYRFKRYLSNLKQRGLKIGQNTHIMDGVFLDPSHCYLISIGDNCTLAPNVRLIAHDASTKKILDIVKMGKINIKNNCFIGDSTLILPGVVIGPNSIIGAGSIVTKDIPPNTVAAGNPARVISTIEDYIKKIRDLSKNKKVFTKDKLDNKKKQGIIQSLDDSIGFIV